MPEATETTTAVAIAIISELRCHGGLCRPLTQSMQDGWTSPGAHAMHEPSTSIEQCGQVVMGVGPATWGIIRQVPRRDPSPSMQLEDVSYF